MKDKTNDKSTTTTTATIGKGNAKANTKATANSAIRLFVLTSESNERPTEDITHVCVHSSVQEVFGKEFENMRQLQHLHLCQGVQSIGPKAFKDCCHLKTVSMAFLCSLQSIGYRSFYFCTSLVTINLKQATSLQTIGFAAFGNCQSLETVQLPCSLKKLEDWAFSHCVSLRNIQIPLGVESIGRLAFLNCSSLREISIPSSVEVLGEWCFQDCSLLSRVHCLEEEPQPTTTNTTKRTEIRMGTFANCQALEYCSIPQGIEVIGSDAFRDCTSLVSLDLLGNKKESSPSSLKYIHAKAFYGCSSLCAMTIPDSTIGIGDRAFYGCSNLVSVELMDNNYKNSQSSIQFGSEAFAHCPSLVNIALSVPSSKAIPQDLFAGCSKLRGGGAVVVPEEGQDDPANPYLPTLQDRFANLPVHEACYHSSTTTKEDLLSCIQQESSSSPPSPEEDENDDLQVSIKTDSLGMTPFHVLATCTTPRTDLLQVLLDHYYYPLDSLAKKDSSNKTMMEYLVVDPRPTCLPLVQMVLCKTIVDGMHSWGKPSWRSTMQDMIGSFLSQQWGTNDKTIRRQALSKIHQTLESYARCEVMSLLDLAVWKTHMESSSLTAEEDDDEEPPSSSVSSSKVDRDNARLLCGANIVKSKVFDFLCCDQDNNATISTNHPATLVATSIFPYDLSWMRDVCCEDDSNA